MREKAVSLLQTMREQEAYFTEQLAMTRGAVQILEELLDEGEGQQDLPPDIEDVLNDAQVQVAEKENDDV